jgi:nucleoside-diphosphate-sugar epimerase
VAVLVTGGAGFVGLNLSEALLARGEAVVLFDRGVLPPAVQRALSCYARQLTVVEGSVLDAQQVADLVAKHRIERIAHCAAITSGPEREAGEPAAIVEVNVRGTISVLDAARRHGVKRVVYTSSGAVYGESLYRLTRLYEESPALPLTLYAITKFSAERICARLKELWELDVVCARLGTVIGPWERATGARDNYGTHTQLAGLAVAGKTAVLTPHEVRRDWVYSRDVAEGLIALLEAPAPRYPVYNLSSGMDWSGAVLAWSKALKSAFGNFSYRVAADGERPNIWYTDRDRYPMDVGRIAQDIGFTPRFGPREAYADYLESIRRMPDFWQAM